MDSKTVTLALAVFGATLLVCFIVLSHERGMDADTGCLVPLSATELAVGGSGLIGLLAAGIRFLQTRHRRR